MIAINGIFPSRTVGWCRRAVGIVAHRGCVAHANRDDSLALRQRTVPPLCVIATIWIEEKAETMTRAWYMTILSAFREICRERRRLHFQLRHDEAYTAALQKLSEAANRVKAVALNQS